MNLHCNSVSRPQSMGIWHLASLQVAFHTIKFLSNTKQERENSLSQAKWVFALRHSLFTLLFAPTMYCTEKKYKNNQRTINQSKVGHFREITSAYESNQFLQSAFCLATGMPWKKSWQRYWKHFTINICKHLDEISIKTILVTKVHI